jgi:hypothetical protein
MNNIDIRRTDLFNSVWVDLTAEKYQFYNVLRYTLVFSVQIHAINLNILHSGFKIIGGIIPYKGKKLDDTI